MGHFIDVDVDKEVAWHWPCATCRIRQSHRKPLTDPESPGYHFQAFRLAPGSEEKTISIRFIHCFRRFMEWLMRIVNLTRIFPRLPEYPRQEIFGCKALCNRLSYSMANVCKGAGRQAYWRLGWSLRRFLERAGDFSVSWKWRWIGKDALGLARCCIFKGWWLRFEMI